ncbi:MAG: hypothetical protein V7676_13445 [Parasphingorhabdus sp.]|uniref:hypothetical protein n=1 Tax=Parasphingorhabdus sp. TaxID=2709688 RepID=UPI003002C702
MEILIIAGIIILMVLIFDSRNTIATLRDRIELLENNERISANSHGNRDTEH